MLSPRRRDKFSKIANSRTGPQGTEVHLQLPSNYIDLLAVMSKIIFKTIQNQNHFQKVIVKSKSKSQHDKRFKIEIASEVILNHKIKIIGHKL